jgi:hypothetical protein
MFHAIMAAARVILDRAPPIRPPSPSIGAAPGVIRDGDPVILR